MSTSSTNKSTSSKTADVTKKALPKAELALKARVGVLGNSDPDATHDMLTLGSLYYLTGRYDDADPLFKQALAVREKAYGRDDPQVAQVLGDLGHLYATGEKYPEARAYYERALAILEKNPGPQAKSSIFALVNTLASLDRDTGEYEQAGGALWPGPFARRAAIGRRRASPGVGARRCCLLLRGYRGLRARRVAAAARARNS